MLTEARKEYNRKYWIDNKDKIDDNVRNQIDRMQVKAFQSFFKEQFKEFHRTPEYALAFAMMATNDIVMRDAMINRPQLMQRWLDKDFDKINPKEREARQAFLKGVKEPKRYRSRA